MELNAEEIIKAMECCYDNNLSCLDCPYQATDKFLECSNLSITALALIKELTEENEYLIDSLAKQCAENVILVSKNNHIKSDTVREMRERILAKKVSYGNVTFRVVPIDDINQIAKELIGDE